MGREKCRACVYHTLDYSPIYSTYIEGCSYEGPKRNGGCDGIYKKKEPPKAYIKRRITN